VLMGTECSRRLSSTFEGWQRLVGTWATEAKHVALPETVSGQTTFEWLEDQGRARISRGSRPWSLAAPGMQSLSEGGGIGSSRTSLPTSSESRACTAGIGARDLLAVGNTMTTSGSDPNGSAA
jgi:hypothetical protein